MQGATRPRDPDRAGVGAVDAREQFQQRALARAVAADDAEELAALDLELDAAQRLQLAVLGVREELRRALLERVDARGRDPEALLEAAHLDRDVARLGRRHLEHRAGLTLSKRLRGHLAAEASFPPPLRSRRRTGAASAEPANLSAIPA